MAIEIEAKMAIKSVEDMAQRLRRVGAACLGTVTERNIYFDTPDARLKAADEGLRIRCERREGQSESRAVVTYKGPRQGGLFKTRNEIEFTVSDAAATKSLLDALKYVRVLTFEKRRQTWTLRTCEVVLDTLPKLGNYMEIEGPDEAAVDGVRQSLDLADAPLITASYPALICGFLNEHDIAREGREVVLEF